MAMTRESASDNGPIAIKKYANRRLYNTASSSYVTIDGLAAMVAEGMDFRVFDAQSGEDITAVVLLQIVLDRETGGQQLLPVSFLRCLIGFYGDSLQPLVPRYLEHAMQTFVANGGQLRDHMRDAESTATIDGAMQICALSGDTGKTIEAGNATEKAIEELRMRLDRMQEQIDDLADNVSSH